MPQEGNVETLVAYKQNGDKWCKCLLRTGSWKARNYSNNVSLGSCILETLFRNGRKRLGLRHPGLVSGDFVSGLFHAVLVTLNTNT